MSEFYNPNEKNETGTVYSGTVMNADTETPINIVVDKGERICSRCGSRLEEGDVFCGKCGTAADMNSGGLQPSYDPGRNATQAMHQQPNGVITPSYDNAGGAADKGAFVNRTQGNQFGQAPVVNNYYYGSNNNITANVSGGKVKDKYVSLILCGLLGCLGVHRYYEGKIPSAILYTCTGGIFGVGALIDFIILLFKPRWYTP